MNIKGWGDVERDGVRRHGVDGIDDMAGLGTVGPLDWHAVRCCGRRGCCCVVAVADWTVVGVAAVRHVRSLEGVGEAVGGALGGGLCAVADALHRGSSWKDAWNAADFGDYAETSAILRGVLGPSWTRGVSPIGPLTTASEQWTEGERTAIEQESASLSVKLLLPTGLCMLPAFVFLGILPSVMAFVG